METEVCNPGPPRKMPRLSHVTSLQTAETAEQAGVGAGGRPKKGKPHRRKQNSGPVNVAERTKESKVLLDTRTRPSDRKTAGARQSAAGRRVRAHTRRGRPSPAWGRVASRPPARACRHVCAHRQTHAGTRATVSAHVHACPAARLTSPSHGSVPPCPPRWPRPRRGPRHCTAPP